MSCLRPLLSATPRAVVHESVVVVVVVVVAVEAVEGAVGLRQNPRRLLHQRLPPRSQHPLLHQQQRRSTSPHSLLSACLRNFGQAPLPVQLCSSA